MQVSWVLNLRNIYTGIENINRDFQAKSELILNMQFMRERSVRVSVKTEWNVSAA
jgi:hypothetical protein